MTTPPEELLRSVGLVAYPAGVERELLYNEHSGSARLLTYEDGDLLAQCGSFRGLSEHAAEICRASGWPDARRPAVRSQLALLARAGFLVRRSELLGRLASKAPPPSEPLQEPRFLPGVDASTRGGRLNAALLGSPGRRILLDDAPVRSFPPRPSAFTSEARPAESTPSGEPLSSREAHARALGAAPADLAEEGVDLDGLDARFLRRLRRGDGFVAMSVVGTTGRRVDRLTLLNRPISLDGPLGLDNRRLLPPAPSLDAGAREVFALALRKTWERAFIVLLPGAADASEAPPPGEIAELLLAILDPFDLGPILPDGEPRLLALAEHLRAVGSLPPDEFRPLALSLLRHRRPALAKELSVPDGGREAVLAYAALLADWPRLAAEARAS